MSDRQWGNRCNDLDRGRRLRGSDITISKRITVTGDVHLILGDGCTLTASEGISVEEGNSLTVYAQSQGENMGKLNAIGKRNAAGIGSGYEGNVGNITINGGTVTAAGGESGAGIGGVLQGNGGNIIINGGTVISTGGERAAGIGSGYWADNGTITIYGGTVTATGGEFGAGIGGGDSGAGGTITIHGGTVTATGGEYGVGIGDGRYGRGIVIDGSKAAHTSTGDNVATCTKLAVCDDCGVSYGDFADHDWNTSWEKDATNHWHKCNTAGCTEKKDFAAHTPDHEGGATEEYAIACTDCGWIIEQQLNHTHVYDKEVAQEQYLADKATCTEPAKYYKSCKCGEKGTETFTSGTANGHTAGAEWKSDKDNHWHICTVAGCGAVIDSSKTAHTPDRAAATETDPVKCSVCGYEIAPALGHTHAYGAAWKSDADNHWNECACGDKANTAAHKDENADGKCDVCEYNVGTPVGDKPSDNPQTGDNNMMHLWIILLCVSAMGIVAISVFGKKKSVR